MAPDSNVPDINKSLKDYLNRNESGTSEEKSKLLRSSWSLDSWFSGRNQNNLETENNETINSVSWYRAAESDKFCPSLSKKQRIAGFIGCFGMGIFCFVLAGFYAPFLLLKARKFCLLYTMGSLFVIGSFSLLFGPYNHLKHLFSWERLGFTSVYIGTMFATLYYALWVKSTLFTAIFAIFQFIAFLWYVTSYMPYGPTTLKFFSRICTSMVTRTTSNLLPV